MGAAFPPNPATSRPGTIRAGRRRLTTATPDQVRDTARSTHLSSVIAARHARLHRRRLAVAVAVAVALAATVHTGWRAEAARQRWGTTQTAVVAVTSLAAGDVIGLGAVTTVELPAIAVPATAVTGPAAELVGRRTTAAIAAGEVVVDQRVAPPGASATTARLDDRQRAVALSTSGPTPALNPGDLVDVVAVDGPYSARTVASAVEVVAVDPAGGSITVVVPATDVAELVAAVVTATVVPVVRR
jgi:Flp pilus assembly protein CpaB